MLNRRDALKALSLTPLALAPLALAVDQQSVALKGNAKLIVDSIEVFRVKVNQRGNWMIARLKTAGGITGLGDASQSTKVE